MRFEFIADEHVKVKTFLKKHQVSKGLLAKIKFSGGQILVNGIEQNAIYLLDIGDKVTIDIPSEEGYEALEAIDRDLEILYEDDHFLVLNKPAGVASIPSSLHSNTIANFVKGYYVRNQYENQLVHIVTRLDKDTSGIMLFAKHGYAHARLDKQLQAKTIQKRYFALVKGTGELARKGDIIAPIARNEDSIITRKVAKVASMLIPATKLSSLSVIFIWWISNCIQAGPIRFAFIFLILVIRFWEMIFMVVP